MAAKQNAVVRARVNEEVKRKAEVVLSQIGLTTSDAFRLLIMRIAEEEALPFSPLVPNKTTIEAMLAARRGELVEVGSVDELFEELNTEDD